MFKVQQKIVQVLKESLVFKIATDLVVNKIFQCIYVQFVFKEKNTFPFATRCWNISKKERIQDV